MEMLLAVVDDMIESSANLGRKLVVETFDSFLAVAEDDCSTREVSCQTCLVALRGKVLIGLARRCFAYGPRKYKRFVVAIPCRKQMAAVAHRDKRYVLRMQHPPQQISFHIRRRH